MRRQRPAGAARRVHQRPDCNLFTSRTASGALTVEFELRRHLYMPLGHISGPQGKGTPPRSTCRLFPGGHVSPPANARGARRRLPPLRNVRPGREFPREIPGALGVYRRAGEQHRTSFGVQNGHLGDAIRARPLPLNHVGEGGSLLRRHADREEVERESGAARAQTRRGASHPTSRCLDGLSSLGPARRLSRQCQ